MLFQIVLVGFKIVNTLACVHVFFQNAVPLSDKANQLLLVLWNALENYLLTGTNIKDFTDIVRALFIEIFKNNWVDTLFESISHR